MTAAIAAPAKKAHALTRRCAAVALILSTGITAGLPAAAADVAKGAQLAQQWCANCHVIGGKAPEKVQEGPPSFRTIARSSLTEGQLRAFLSHPHGAMPDLALTREEIDDLIGYIKTLR